jgi:iron-sulfur cluster assembly protein
MVDTIIVDEVGKVRIPTEIEGALSEDDLFISDKAIEMIQEIRKQNNVPEDYFLRIATRGGGCSGMNYALGFDNEFDEQNDRKFVTDKVNLVVDAKSLFYLMGVTLDFVDGPDGSGFVFNNPNNAHTCGCHG